MTDAINHKGFSKTHLLVMIDSMSPLENSPQTKKKYEEWFPARERISMGFSQNMSHNGGYQMLAYFYAATGNVKRTLQCLDSLNKHIKLYDQSFNNSTQIASYFLSYGNQDAFLEFVTAYSKVLRIPAYAFVKEMLNRISVAAADNSIKFVKHGNFNDVLKFFDEHLATELFDVAKELSRRELKSIDALNYNLALLNKHQGILTAKKAAEWGIHSLANSDSLFNVALSYYGKIDPAYLEETVELDVQTGLFASEKRSVARKHQFLYPDHFRTVESFVFAYAACFSGDDFFKFMIRNKLFSLYYKGQDDYELVVTWINKYFAFEGDFFRVYLNYKQPPLSTFVSVDSLIAQSGYDLDNAWLKLKLIQNYFERGDTMNAYRQVRTLKFKQFVKGDFNEETLPFYNSIIIVAGELAVRGKTAECLRIISRFSNTRNRVTAYARLTSVCLLNQKFAAASAFADSAKSELNRVRVFQSDSRDFRLKAVEAVILQNDRNGRSAGLEFIGSMNAGNRFQGVLAMVGAYAQLNELNKARRAVPDLASANDRLVCYYSILIRENLRRGNNSGEWKDYYQAEIINANFTYFQNDLAAN